MAAARHSTPVTTTAAGPAPATSSAADSSVPAPAPPPPPPHALAHPPHAPPHDQLQHHLHHLHAAQFHHQHQLHIQHQLQAVAAAAAAAAAAGSTTSAPAPPAIYAGVDLATAAAAAAAAHHAHVHAVPSTGAPPPPVPAGVMMAPPPLGSRAALVAATAAPTAAAGSASGTPRSATPAPNMTPAPLSSSSAPMAPAITSASSSGGSTSADPEALLRRHKANLFFDGLRQYLPTFHTMTLDEACQQARRILADDPVPSAEPGGAGVSPVATKAWTVLEDMALAKLLVEHRVLSKSDAAWPPILAGMNQVRPARVFTMEACVKVMNDRILRHFCAARDVLVHQLGLSEDQVPLTEYGQTVKRYLELRELTLGVGRRRWSRRRGRSPSPASVSGAAAALPMRTTPPTPLAVPSPETLRGILAATTTTTTTTAAPITPMLTALSPQTMAPVVAPATAALMPPPPPPPPPAAMTRAASTGPTLPAPTSNGSTSDDPFQRAPKRRRVDVDTTDTDPAARDASSPTIDPTTTATAVHAAAVAQGVTRAAEALFAGIAAAAASAAAHDAPPPVATPAGPGGPVAGVAGAASASASALGVLQLRRDVDELRREVGEVRALVEQVVVLLRVRGSGGGSGGGAAAGAGGAGGAQGGAVPGGQESHQSPAVDRGVFHYHHDGERDGAGSGDTRHHDHDNDNDRDLPQRAARAAAPLSDGMPPPPPPAAGATAASALAPFPADDPLAELLGMLAPPHLSTTSSAAPTDAALRLPPRRRRPAGDRPSSDLASAPSVADADLWFAFETTPALDENDDQEEEDEAGATAVDDAVPATLPSSPLSPPRARSPKRRPGATQSQPAATGSSARPIAAPVPAPAPVPARPPSSSSTSSAQDDTEYEVHTLASRRPLLHRGKYMGFEYEVVWSDGSRTWEPESNLSGCAVLLAEFEERERAVRERKVATIMSRRKLPGRGRGRKVEYNVVWTDGTKSWERADTLPATAHDLIAAFEAAQVTPAHYRDRSIAPIGDRTVTPSRRSTRVTRASARARSPTPPPAPPADSDDDDDGWDEDTAASYDLSSADNSDEHDDDNDDDDNDDDDSDYGAPRSRRATTRSARKYAATASAAPAVSSTAVERRLRTAPHATTCFACARGDELEKKPRRAGGRKRRDEFSDSDDEAPRGMLRKCGKCTAAYHYVCVPRRADKRGRATMAPADEDSEFVCPHCEQDAEADTRKDEEAEVPADVAPMAEASSSAVDPAPDAMASAADPTSDDATATATPKPATQCDLLFPATTASSDSQLSPPITNNVCPYCPLTPPAARAVSVPTDLRFRCRTCHVAMHWSCAGAHLNVGLRAFHWNSASPAPPVPDPTPATAATLTTLLDRGECGACRACSTYGIERLVTHRDARPFREILVKWAGASFRHARWVPEPTVRGIQGRKLDMFLRRMAGRAAVPSAKDVVPRAWTQVHKVLAMDDDGHVLVKWRGLPPAHATWEEVEDMECNEDADYLCAVVAYQIAAEIDTVSMRRDRAASAGDEDARPDSAQRVTSLPKGMAGGTLKPHQVSGLQWLLDRWAARTPCILADEMGLGKTVQVLALLHVLLTIYQRAPFLIVAPNSTLDHWERECARWAPALTVVTAWGTAADRKAVLDHELLAESMKCGGTAARAGRGGGTGATRRSADSKTEVSLKCHVVLASYESVQQMPELSRVRWSGVIVDEGHKLKNDEAKLFAYLAAMHADHRVLLSGTPLQNSVRELVNLLHFLDPTEFPDPAALADEFNVLDEADATARAAKVRALHAILRPRLLRRTKDDVDMHLPPRRDQVVAVRMSPLQRELVRDIYSSNFELLKALGVQAAAAATGTGTTTSAAGSVVRSASLQNIVMQCRKVLSHPFTLPAVEQGLPATTNAHVRLVESAGKLALLDRILPRLQAGGHKLLIFAQFMSTLDILEDYLIGCKLANPFSYYRLDGDTPRPQRQDRIDRFNNDPDALVFLLSTRAGGVGVTLTAADTVIVYDLDWNPHWDAQAIARAHRIGQTKPVLALRFVTAQSVEERMAAVAHRKLALDHAVVQAMRGGGKGQGDDENPDEDLLKDVVQYGARAAFAADEEAEGKDVAVGVYADEEIDRMLDRTALENDKVDEADRPKSTTPDGVTARPATPADVGGACDDAEWTAVLARVRAVADAAARRDAAALAQGRRRRRTTTQGAGPAFDDMPDDGDGEYVPPAADAAGEAEDMDEDVGDGITADVIADLGGIGLVPGAAADRGADAAALAVGGADENAPVVPPPPPPPTTKGGDKAPRKRKRKDTTEPATADGDGAKANGEGKKRRRKTATADGTAGKAEGEGKKKRKKPLQLAPSSAVHEVLPPTAPMLPARAESVPPPRTAVPLAPSLPMFTVADLAGPSMFVPTTGRARAHTTGSAIPISTFYPANPHFASNWLAPALAPTSATTAASRSPGAIQRRRAARAARGYQCWICSGSLYATAAHHLPTRCAALTDRAWCEMRWQDARARGLTGFATVLARAVQAAEAMAVGHMGGVQVKREGGGGAME
ncbi:hypothetical protein GGF31_004258 [Allomyces arbusculus]|nr:hypothetical protein GGF31_004258 [Allomyces arbusculus]